MKTFYRSTFMIAALFNFGTATALKAQLVQPGTQPPLPTSTQPPTLQSEVIASQGFQDNQLTKLVRQNLAQDISLSGFVNNINVVTINSDVTLSGVVLSAAEKSRIENIARATQGVKSVRNDLTVQSGTGTTP
jgi:hypothetical protein